MWQNGTKSRENRFSERSAVSSEQLSFLSKLFDYTSELGNMGYSCIPHLFANNLIDSIMFIIIWYISRINKLSLSCLPYRERNDVSSVRCRSLRECPDRGSVRRARSTSKRICWVSVYVGQNERTSRGDRGEVRRTPWRPPRRLGAPRCRRV